MTDAYPTQPPNPLQSSPQSLLDSLDRTLELAFPPALAQLTQSLMDPMPNFSTISRYLGMDPALAAAVLNIANSPIYGFSMKITDIQRAAIALGTRELFKLVIALAIQKRMHGLLRRSPEAQFGDWRITLWGAIAAEEIAMTLAPDKSAEAYLGTLLKDLPLLLALCGDNAPDWLVSVPMLTMCGKEQAESERQTWGIEHAALAGRLLERWHFSPELAEAVTTHHDALDDIGRKPLARCLALATRWAELLHGNTDDIAPLAAFEVTLAAALSLSSSEMEGLRQRCTTLFKTMLPQLGVQEAPSHTRFYEYTLPTLQNLYFLSLELFAEEDGLAGMARRLRRQLRLHWGIDEWELGLRIQDSALFMLYRCTKNMPEPLETGPLDPAEIKWTPGLERFAFITSGNHWGQIRLPAAAARTSRETLALYFHFVSVMLDRYHKVRARREKQADTMAALPIGVARLDEAGQFIDANQTFLHMFSLPGVPQRMPVTALLQHRFATDILQEWQSFIASDAPLYSRVMQPRTSDPLHPGGLVLLVHRLRDKDNEFLLLLEDAGKFSDLQESAVRHSQFVNRILAAMPGIILTLNAEGEVTWASPRGAGFLGKNIFDLAKPATAFFQSSWDKNFLAGVHQTTVMEVQLQNESPQSELFELLITPMPDAADQTMLALVRDMAAVRHIDDNNRLQSNLDPVTGLLIHSQFHVALEREADRARHTGKAIGIIFCDLEGFKQVNAMYGYQTGDSVLRRVGATINAVVRKGLDVPARFGGDDFAVIVGGPSREQLENTAVRIQQGVQAACKGSVQMNCGLCLLSGGESSQWQALEAAKKACARSRGMPGRLAWAEETSS